MNKKQVALYNIIFPFWLIFLFPPVILFVIIGNFLIDSLVLAASMCFLKVENKKKFYLKSIWKAYLFGFAADIVGAVIAFAAESVSAVIGFWMLIILSVLAAAALIFLLNYFISFRKCDKKLRFRLSMIFAAVTAPYVFLIPKDFTYSSYYAFNIIFTVFVAVIALLIISTAILLLFTRIKKNSLRKTLSAISASVFAVIIILSVTVSGILLFDLHKIEKAGITITELSREEKNIAAETFKIPGTENSDTVRVYYCGSHELACVTVPKEEKASFIESLHSSYSKEEPDRDPEDYTVNKYFTDIVNNSDLKYIYRSRAEAAPTVYEYENGKDTIFIFEKYAYNGQDMKYKKLFRSDLADFFYEKAGHK